MGYNCRIMHNWLAIVGLLVLIGIAPSQNPPANTPKAGITKGDSGHKGQEQPNGKARSQAAPPTLPPTPQPASPTCDEACQNARKNLQIQDRLVWLTGGLVFVGLLQVGSMIWQAILLRRTHSDVKRQADWMETQSGHIAKQVDLMKDQLDTAREKERPRLRIELKNVKLDFSDSPDMIVIDSKIRNYGGSIAFILASSCGCWIIDAGSETDGQTHPSYDMTLPEVLLPGNSCEPAICLFDEERAVDLTLWDKDDPRIESIRVGERAIIVSGVVMYKNIFEETWILGFKRKYAVHDYAGLKGGEWTHVESAENYDRQELPKPN